MKMLVCTDGSEQSRVALEKAAIIASGCNSDEVTILYVDDGKQDIPSFTRGQDGYVTDKEIEHFKKKQEEHRAWIKEVMSQARSVFTEKGVEAKTIIKGGHPAETIVGTACKEGYDMIVIGSRGLGGLKKLVLGSVSNAVVQEAKNCCVVTVK